MMKQKENHHKVKWSYPSINETPRLWHGVYAFWCRDTAKCIYVGKAVKQPIQDRLRNHWRGSHNETLKLWISAFGENLDICYVRAKPNKISNFERRLIRIWRPEANIQLNL